MIIPAPHKVGASLSAYPASMSLSIS
jgi:hypothetical protein